MAKDRVDPANLWFQRKLRRFHRMAIPTNNEVLYGAAERKSRSLRTIISSSYLLLVPFTEDMMDKYCGWFQDDHLCRITGTDAAIIKDSFTTWTTDPAKIMFIVLDRRKYEPDRKDDAVAAMIGDVNLVISFVEPGSPDSLSPQKLPAGSSLQEVEVMLMLAEPDYRCKGLGTQILHLIMRYGLEELGISVFKAHISRDNHQSLRLFQSAGYSQTHYSEVFGEYALTLNLDLRSKSALIDKTDAIGYSLLLET
ncbi:hypothetical protein RvY_09098 [Ramazzottius varieornatus]|uniref:N-acetyltransferase domain-containing protein n=1 Tax=Ramazzottius varieornatus TaxID=947166 RepID=A0A1D1VCS1_RAMVA|nr:hypothetical protein RvY_09098 [Ramazzottius varieornatus]